MKTCPSCKHNDIHDFSLYCGYCGYPVVENICEINTCAYCGNQIPVTERNCPSCGASRRKINPVYAKRVRLRKCGACGTMIPYGDRYCLSCGQDIPDNRPQTKRADRIRRLCMLVSALIIVVCVIIIPTAIVLSDRAEDAKWEREYETSRLEAYQRGLAADYAEYDIEEILGDMRDDNFDRNYKAKYDNKYICVTAAIHEMGYGGIGTKIIPPDGEYSENRRILLEFYDSEVGSEFAGTYIKGDIVRIYGYVSHLYGEMCELTVYRVEPA